MSFESTNAQLLSAPPYIAGAVATVLSSIWADKRDRRMPPIITFQALVVVAMAVLFAFAPNISNNIALCYVMVVLACVGVYPIIPACNAWTVNNLAGPEKRVAGIAFMVTMGDVGGFVGSWIFLENESPEYPTGFGTSLAVAAAGVLAALTLEWSYSRHNKQWQDYSRDQIEDMYTSQQLSELGDRSPLFKYGL